MKIAGRSIKEIIINIVIPVILLILAILSVFLPIHNGDANKMARINTLIEKDGAQHTGYAIENLEQVNSYIYVNHYPDEFVMPNERSKVGKVERIDNLTPAKKGTLQFFTYNYNKDTEESERSNIFVDELNDTNTLLFYMPFAFDNAVLWTGEKYYGTYGKMDDYDINDYNVTGDKILPISRKKEPVTLDVIFPIDNESIPENRLDGARVLTVHYEARMGANFRNNVPLIGARYEIDKVIRVKYNTTASCISIMIALIVAFIGLIVLKFSYKQIPILGIAVSALLLLASQFVSLKHNVIAGKALTIVAISILMISALSSCVPKGKVGKRVWLASLVFQIINAILLIFVWRVISFNAYKLYLRIATLIAVITNLIFLLLTIKYKSSVECIALIIALITPIVAFFANYTIVYSLQPSCWLLSVSALIILWIIFNNIMQIEKRNQLLTSNLQKEVATQTSTLETALQDREMLISFISHDLRKSSLSIDSLAREILADDNERTRGLANNIIDKNETLLESFSEISNYMKQNYSDESFENIELDEFFLIMEKMIKPDCEANGINITFNGGHYSLRGKRKLLISIISNLIFNAIEHAECRNISVTSRRVKNNVEISVHDDGKGITNKTDIFSPYKTGGDSSDNLGLGLFIVKSEVEGMGGAIEYSIDNGSTFRIVLMLSSSST